MACSTEQDPVFPTASPSHLDASTSLLEGRQTENHSHRKLPKLITWTTALSNSMKLSDAMWGHPRWADNGGEVWQNVVHWRREWQTLQYFCLEKLMNSMKRQNDRIVKEELPRLVGAQYATGDQWRNNSRKNEGMEPKQKQYPTVGVTGDRSKVKCCKEEYCIGTWNVRSMNQGKLEVVKQEMARVNVNILRIGELKWTGVGEFNSDDHYIYYCGQQSLKRNGVAIRVNKRVRNAVLGCSLKNDRMISVFFQGKPFNITVIQVYAPTSNAEEAEFEWFYEDLQDLLELTPKNMSFSL